MEGLFFLFWVNVLILFAIFSAIYCRSNGPCQSGGVRPSSETPQTVATRGDGNSNHHQDAAGDSSSTDTAPAKEPSLREAEAWRDHLIDRLGAYTMEIGEADMILSDESTSKLGGGGVGDSLRAVAHSDPPTFFPSRVDNMGQTSARAHRTDNNVVAGDARVPDVEMGVGDMFGAVNSSPEDPHVFDVKHGVDSVPRRHGSNNLYDNNNDDDGAGGGSRLMLSLPEAGCSREEAARLQRQQGTPSPGGDRRRRRLVPSLCAVCLSSMYPSESVTWSSNKSCQHVFHASCILEWLEESGRKELKRLRRQNQNRSDHAADNETIRCSAPCPCCRQEFIYSS